MRILHVLPELPYPPDAGGRADIWNRIQLMSRLGCDIDGLVMAQRRAPEERHVAELRALLSNLQFVARRPLSRCLATIVPITAARNGTLADIRLPEQYDITIAEGDNVSSIFDNPTLRTTLRVLRVHNNESMYMWLNGKTEEAFLMRQFCRLEALRYIPFSRSLYRRVDFLWFISTSELENFVASSAKSAFKAVWLPPAITFGDEPERCEPQCKRVLYVASLNNSLNREGLMWYLKEVHPRLIQDPGYELVVAGSTGGRASAHLFIRELLQQERCTVQADVIDLTALYNGCAVFINPMQRGTGLKVKNIHAIERRVPVVTTSVGNEGSGLANNEHVRVADTPAAFGSAIMELLGDQCLREQMAVRAYGFLTTHYNADINLQRLLANLLSDDAACAGNEQGVSRRNRVSRTASQLRVTCTPYKGGHCE
jgi:hypothetical protein